MGSIQIILKEYNHFSKNARQHALRFSWENVVNTDILIYLSKQKKKVEVIVYVWFCWNC